MTTLLGDAVGRGAERQAALERARVIVRRITLAALVPIAIFIVHAAVTRSGRALVVLPLTGLASLAGGAVLGFIFALPKTPGGRKPDSETDGEEGLHSVNDNLPEIADWLTKTIVGLGLVQITNIPGWLLRKADWIGNGIPYGTEILVVAIPYFVIAGFLMAYLTTRLDLGPAIADADKRTVGQAVRRELERVQSEQSEDDKKALEMVQQVIDGTRQVSDEEARERLAAASLVAKYDIAVQVQAQMRVSLDRLRDDNLSAEERATARESIESYVPILKSLAELNSHYARNHAELGLALTITGRQAADFKLAAESMGRAIELAGGQREYGGYYQLTRHKANTRYLDEATDLDDKQRQRIKAQIQKDKADLEQNPDLAGLRKQYPFLF